ncbi:MAG: sugar transferase [Chlamydiales bacterium]|nr:sugar transferase [Chlamydiales bacterium]
MCKRLFDIVFSASVLLLGSPIYLMIALAVRITSSGSIFYASSRVGLGGKPFPCWKFRTMFKDADCRLKELLDGCPDLKKEWETFWKLQNDPRVTPVGRFLRKTSLDELPQFWNVLKGDLSVVGPRPVTADEIERYYGDKAEKILSLRPGITGLWQTSGRSLITFEERVNLEESYVEHSSFFYDIKLILKTIPYLFFSRGAF